MFAWVLTRETSAAVKNALGSLFSLEGAPSVMITDNGTCFTSGEFYEFLRSWGVKIKHVPRYAGFYAGFYEKNHHIMVQTLIAVIEETGENWKKALPVALRHMNMRPYEVTWEGKTLSPFEVFKGRSLSRLDMTLPAEDSRPSEDVVMDNIAEILKEQEEISNRLEEVWKDLREKSFKTIEKRHKPAKESLKVGDMVMRYLPKRTRKKYQGRWEGPFVIEKVISDVKVVINGTEEHVFNLKKYEGNAPEDRGVITTSSEEQNRNAGNNPDPLDDDDEMDDEEPPPPRQKRKAALDAMEALLTGGREKRLHVASVVKPRGMLLWLQ